MLTSGTPRAAGFRAKGLGGQSSRPDGPPNPVATGNMLRARGCRSFPWLKRLYRKAGSQRRDQHEQDAASGINIKRFSRYTLMERHEHTGRVR